MSNISQSTTSRAESHSPCIAKKNEIEYGLGSIYPMPGGLKENVYWFCGEDLFIRQIEGEKHAYEFLEDYKKRVLGKKELPFMVDALNCAKGCICGPGVEEEKVHSDDTLYELQKIREASKKNDRWHAFSKSLTLKQRLDRLNKQFADLDINDFIRHYTDKSKGFMRKDPTSAEINEIFTSMEKRTETERSINCSACGYDTCRDMATAIHNGCNNKGNCIQYMKGEVERESEIAKQMAAEVEGKNELLHEKNEKIAELIAELQEDFNSLDDSISEMSQGNDSNAEESTGISTSMKDVVHFCDQLNNALAKIQSLLVKLADSSKDTASDSDSNKEQIQAAIKELLGDAENLISFIDGVNKRVNNLAASTQEIAASADVVNTISADLKDKLGRLNA